MHGHSIKLWIGCKEVSPLIDVMSSPHTALIRGRPVVLVLLEGISDRFIPPIGSRGAQVGVINVLPVELLGLLVGVNLFPLPLVALRQVRVMCDSTVAHPKKRQLGTIQGIHGVRGTCVLVDGRLHMFRSSSEQ